MPCMNILRVARALVWLVYAFVVAAIVILIFGFFLLLFGANPDAEFAQWVYRALSRVMAPFRGLFETVPLNGDSVLDLSVVFAMIVYSIAGLFLHALVEWLTGRIVLMQQQREVAAVEEAPAPHAMA